MLFFKSKEVQIREIVNKGIIAGLIEAAYIIIISLFVLSAGAIFPANSPLMALGLVAFVILLVISVSITGIIIFGVPVYFLLNKKYQQALTFLGSSLLTLLVVFLLFAVISIIF